MKEFEKDLTNLINCHSLENGSDTPDFILAEYLVGCLKAFDHSAKDQATADHAAIIKDVFYTACERRTAWNAPDREDPCAEDDLQCNGEEYKDCLAPGQCGITASECQNCL